MKDIPIILTFGKHKGTPINKVPAGYLLWAIDNIPSLDPRVKEWIELNEDELVMEQQLETELEGYGSGIDWWKD